MSSDLADAAVLPPAQRRESQVRAALQNATAGLPEAGAFDKGDYKPRLALDYVGQPTVAAGVDRYGAVVGGGASFYFSDMLGDHNLGAYVQANGRVKDIGGAVSYVNLKSRLNWGATLQQIPFLTGGFITGVKTVNGEQAFVEELHLLRQTNRGVSGTVAYPLDRARRFELTAGYSHISFDREVETLAVALQTGRILINERRNLPTADSLHLAEAGAAYVHDTSTFGATSPILGSRYRLEVSPLAGSISFTGVLADYRTYVMPLRPYTLALRVLHYGRYGGDAENNPFSPLFIGYPTLVRGYDTGSFTAAECGTAGPDCLVFDQLLGSRILVANLELRFPPWGALGGRRLYGPLPIELGAFFDAGAAWTSSVEPEFLGGDRKVVRSVGGVARLNLFGYAVLEFNMVRPLDRPRKNWQFQFNIRPGF